VSSDLGVFFVLVVIYCWSTVTLGFFLSTFFMKSKTAGALGEVWTVSGLGRNLVVFEMCVDSAGKLGMANGV
jgi:hypothetical protein